MPNMFSVPRTIAAPDAQTDAAIQEAVDGVTSQLFAHGEDAPDSSTKATVYFRTAGTPGLYAKIDGTWTLIAS